MKNKHDPTRKNAPEKDYLKIILAQRYYNDPRIPGYNHLLGVKEGRIEESKEPISFNIVIKNK